MGSLTMEQIRRGILVKTSSAITVTWNQMARPLTSGYYRAYDATNLSVTFSDEVASGEILIVTSGSYLMSVRTKTAPQVLRSHIYYVSYMLFPNQLRTYGIEYAGGRFTTAYDVPENVWTRISDSRDGARDGGGNLYFPYPAPSTAQVGDTFRVKAPIYIDLTEMFGAGNEPTTEEFERQCGINGIDLTQYQPYDEGTQMTWRV